MNTLFALAVSLGLGTGPSQLELNLDHGVELQSIKQEDYGLLPIAHLSMYSDPPSYEVGKKTLEDLIRKKYGIVSDMLQTYDIVDLALGKHTPEPLDTLEIGQDKYVIIIDKEHQVELIYQQRERPVLVEANPISTGLNEGHKRREGDNKTPQNDFGEHYTITEIADTTHWRYEGEPAYGPWGLRLDVGEWDREGAYDPKGRSSILLHGTHEPEVLGKRSSHGCIRHDNETITRIKEQYADIGTKVIIKPYLSFFAQ